MKVMLEKRKIVTREFEISVISYHLLNPDNKNLFGKSWKTHPEIFPKFQFPGCDTGGFLENSSSIFSKFQFLGHELGRFLETRSYLDKFSRNGVSTICSVLDEFSKNWTVSCPKILKLTVG